MSFLQDQPWVFACKGKDRPGDRPGMQLHVWRRREDRTAYCLKCELELTVAQADDCFTQR